jgi:pantetheine-phosphate adenylyltransferase/8-oxo-dGTP diphosphatase
MNKAIYAASLDPITLGHLWVVKQGLEMFDELVVCIAVNPSKVGKYLFSAEERASMARACISPKASVKTIGPNYLVDFIQKEKASYLLRGVRNAEDFSAESTMAEINRKMANDRGFDIETVIVSPRFLQFQKHA